MNPHARTPRLAASLLCLCLWLAHGAPATRAGLSEREFAAPPASARPWVYWFPLDGNITREGITADLEAMARVGIGGVLYMETEQGTPKGPAPFGGPLWRALFQHACKEAARLGLEINMNNDAGWCGSGGPWITPALSMQKLVWTATPLEGPKRVSIALPRPEAVREHYRDIAVLAHPTPPAPTQIAGLRAKAAFVPARGSFPGRAHWPALPAGRTVARAAIVDLSAAMTPDGGLAWDVPAGNWTVLRLGHTSTGKENHPAPEAGRGLECDKLSREGARAMFDGLMTKLIADAGSLAGKTLVSTHIDSWEVGSQNWTPRMREEFRARRGYDLTPYLVTVTGAVVDDLETSERFLWDLRQTISELVLEHYAGEFRALANRHGLRLSIEAYTNCPTDEMAYAGRCDEPMGEFWSWKKFGAAFSCTEMASAAHVYGRAVVGAEAFTANNEEKWTGHPGNIKELGDWAFCEGINRFVFHRYALQPWTDPDRAPGISMGPWGLHYERTQTWWELSRPWHEYLARCQSLLQQGTFVADICLLAPEGSPQTIEGQRAFRSADPATPDAPLERPGHNFDICPAEAILTRTSVKDGRIVMQGGASYALLALPRSETMTPELLDRIRELVEAGATVAGNRPSKSPSLSDRTRADTRVRALAQALWGNGPAPDAITERRVGKGRIFHGGALAFSLPPLNPEGAGLARAQWIWRAEGKPRSSFPPGQRCFRRVFTLGSAPVTEARLTMTADNEFDCRVNGQPVLAGRHFAHAATTDVARHLRPGTNLITVLAENTTAAPNPAGLIAALTVRCRDGTSVDFVTDKSWEAAETAPADWHTDPAPAPCWAPALEQGRAGVKPWGVIDESDVTEDLYPDVAALGRLLLDSGVPPDFAQRTRSGAPNLRFTHRRVDQSDIYFVANRAPAPEQAICTFRVTGKIPELWDPMTGATRTAEAWWTEGSCTHLPLALDEAGSIFVVFRTPTDQGADRARAEPPAPRLDPLQEIAGPWQVRFDPHRGGPAHPVTFAAPQDWAQHPEPGIRFYSGTARYDTKFDFDPTRAAPGRPIVLDLGRVEVIACVRINGKEIGTLWKSPYRIDVTSALRPGPNTLAIEVANLWVNRQIGDELLPDDSPRTAKGTLDAWPAWINTRNPSPTGRHTFTTWRLWKRDDPLQPSGLIGPVTLKIAR